MRSMHTQFIASELTSLRSVLQKLSNKEKKQRAKVRAARRDRGEEVSESEEDE